jgi:enoyl-CoA hydratase
MNALNWSVMNDLEAAFDRLADDDVRTVIVTGAGDKAFVAGADIEELQKLASGEDALRWARFGQAVFAKIEHFPKPVIMAINGYCLGGGCELALAGDVRIASEHAKFGQPEIDLGISPGWAGTQRLPRLIGKARAKLLIFTGAHIDAHEALRIGLVDEVVPSDQLLSRAEELGETLAAKAPVALRLAKESINLSSEVGLEYGCAVEAAYFAVECKTEDRLEGTTAFLEKRKPVFKGR